MNVLTRLGYTQAILSLYKKLCGDQKRDAPVWERIHALRRLLTGENQVPTPDSPSFKGAERAYGGKDAYKRAKAAGRTRLNYLQWIQVRTTEFKESFGNWEAVKGVAMLEGQKPMNLDGVELAADQKAIESIFKSFGEIENKKDLRSVKFLPSMAGKIYGHDGFDVKRIARAFDRLFKAAIPMTSELEEPRPGHKDHTSNIAGYHHYVGKFEQDGKAYYIRFTVWGMKAKYDREGEQRAHSSFVSDITLYEQDKEKARILIQPVSGIIRPGFAETTPLDDKLAQWLLKGKEKLRGKTDSQTGEPLASDI